MVHVPAGAGGPDGLTVDADGRIWVALWGGSAVHCYTPDGSLVEVLDVPASHVTACTFGGPGLATLYITTSQVDTDRTVEPLAGAVFQADVGVRGLPVLPYRTTISNLADIS